MRHHLFCFFLILCIIPCCSYPEPSQQFLKSNMRIVTNDKKDGELLRMKPIDLFLAFDINVTKKWKKIHENSWSLIISGKDPVTKTKTKIVITLSMYPQINYDVVINKLVVNDEEFSLEGIAEMMRELDENYIP